MVDLYYTYSLNILLWKRVRYWSGLEPCHEPNQIVHAYASFDCQASLLPVRDVSDGKQRGHKRGHFEMYLYIFYLFTLSYNVCRVRPSDHINEPQLRSFLCLKSRSYLPFSVERCVFSVVIRMLTVSTEPTDKKYVCNNVLNVHIVASIIATMCS